MRRTVVLSDTHFGEPDAILGSQYRKYHGRLDRPNEPGYERAFGVFFDFLAQLGSIDEMILLGDIFEIWRFPWLRAQQDAQEFFTRLLDLPIHRFVMCPGNHDHPHLIELEYGLPVNSETSPNIRHRFDRLRSTYEHFSRSLLPNACDAGKLVVEYPIFTRTIGGRVFGFHHGHYLQYLPFMPQLTSLKRGRLGLLPSSLAEMEERWTKIFDTFHRLGVDASRRERADNVIAGPYLRLARMVRYLWQRVAWSALPRSEASQTERDYIPAIGNLFAITRQELGIQLRCDVFVHGHTHVPALQPRSSQSGCTRVGLGCWMVKRVPLDATRNVFAVIDDVQIELMAASNSGIALFGRAAIAD